MVVAVATLDHHLRALARQVMAPLEQLAERILGYLDPDRCFECGSPLRFNRQQEWFECRRCERGR